MFVAGGYGAKLSKVLGSTIHASAAWVGVQLVEPAIEEGSWREIKHVNIPLNPVKFNHKEVTKFTPDCDFPGTVAFRTSMENQAEVVGLKLKELSTALAANPKWSGCQCKVPVDFSSIAATMLPDDVDLSQAGSEPWAGLAKLNAWRFGPGATSLPGVGAFYMPLSEQALILTVIPLSLVLKEGVSLKDTKAFLDTREGLKVPAGLLMDEAITKRMLKNPNMFLDILTTC